MKNYRIGNIELRSAHTFAIRNKPSVEYWEIVKWYKNMYYGHKEDYEEIPDNPGFYRLKVPCVEWAQWCSVHESCFKNPETCYTIATFEPWNEDTSEEPDCTTVGSRDLQLNRQDLEDFLDCKKNFYKQWRDETIEYDD